MTQQVQHQDAARIGRVGRCPDVEGRQHMFFPDGCHPGHAVATVKRDMENLSAVPSTRRGAAWRGPELLPLLAPVPREMHRAVRLGTEVEFVPSDADGAPLGVADGQRAAAACVRLGHLAEIEGAAVITGQPSPTSRMIEHEDGRLAVSQEAEIGWNFCRATVLHTIRGGVVIDDRPEEGEDVLSDAALAQDRRAIHFTFPFGNVAQRRSPTRHTSACDGQDGSGKRARSA